MDSEENATSCPVCRRIYCDPRSLSCGHSFCLNCLKGVAGNNRRFRCPLCRFEVNLRYTNVDQLPKNFVLCSVIEAREKKKPSMCLDHKKPFDFFCQRCDVVICSKCLTMQHKGHAIEDIEIIYSERNKQYGALLESTNYLAWMIEGKRDVVKQSRISMEKNIDSISNTVDNTFKKWNDALEKQHNAICSYLHQERERKKQVFSEAERMIADSMTTVTGLETEISKLRSKDTAFVVQQYGSIKARLEDTERKIRLNIEKCFKPPDDLMLEVYAPWIDEAIDNIKHIDKKQTQATPGQHQIAEIQEENVILKRLPIDLGKKTDEVQDLMRRLKQLQDENIEIQKEANLLRTRLSEHAGALLTHDNPSIADLSDPNRPTKFAEKYSELYDNQWTDAFANIAKEEPDISEKDIIRYLYGMLVDGYRFCEDVRRKQILALEDILFDPAGGMKTSQRRQEEEISATLPKYLSDVAKLSSNVSSAHMAKAFAMDKKTKDKYSKVLKPCETYIQECVQLCWLMHVQTPPLCLDLKTIQGHKFDKTFYKEYTKTGTKIAFIIWPALFLHDKGQLLSKGVAQCE